ncbi:PcfJ domain-containing protein [Candidatus Poribacteria bacterium]|nr:PcfJ domain-containing protein [Candidatus Poribacteria bacterium]
MAQKRKVNPRNVDIDSLPSAMKRHFEQLGLSTIDEYKNWCKKNEFSSGLNKDSHQRWNELSKVSIQKIDGVMSDEKRSRNLKDVIPKIYNGELTPDQLRNNITKEIAQIFQNQNQTDLLLNLLLHIEEKSELLDDIRFVTAIHTISKYSNRWIRPIQTWKVKKHNRNRQFADLLRHLFVAYDIPAFMDNVWFTDNSTHHEWYIHIGSGQNIRSAPDMPVTITKKMAHHFLLAPKQYSVEEAIRWGQVQALGGDKRLIDAIRETHLIRDFSNDEFWLSVIRFFIGNPMLDVSHVNPIVDYIQNQKYTNRQIFIDRGVAEEIEPPQPNFTMKGRTPDTILQQVNEWHRQLGRETRGGNYQWTRSKIRELNLIQRPKDKESERTWVIRELLSSKELIDEGRRMNHCVRSYGKSCHSGKTSIWTLEVTEKDKVRKVLTIEVMLAQMLIRQVRGKRNRLPTKSEKNIISQWAAREDLKIADYVRFV